MAPVSKFCPQSRNSMLIQVRRLGVGRMELKKTRAFYSFHHVFLPYGSDRPICTPILTKIRWIQSRAYTEPREQSIQFLTKEIMQVVKAQSRVGGVAYVYKWYWLVIVLMTGCPLLAGSSPPGIPTLATHPTTHSAHTLIPY